MGQYSKLCSLIRMSSLSPDNIDFLTNFFHEASEDDLALLTKLVEQDFKWLYKINRNIRAKKKALDKKDIKLWQKIINEEKEELLARDK